MKKILYSISILLLCALGNAADLKDWKMQREGSSRSYDVAVPCTVAGALNEAGVFGGNVLEGLHDILEDRLAADFLEPADILGGLLGLGGSSSRDGNDDIHGRTPPSSESKRAR